MTVRSFRCMECDLSFDCDVGEIGFEGLLPSMKKSAICPNCGSEITTTDVLSQVCMAAMSTPDDVRAAVERLIHAESWEQRRTVLESTPILLSQVAEDELESQLDVVRSIGIGDEAKGAEQLVWLVRRCRGVGIERTFHELTMSAADRVKSDYLEVCRQRGYDPTTTDWNAFSSIILPHMKQLIAEERRSAMMQGVSDPALDGKTDADVLKERMSGKQSSPAEQIIAPLTHEMRRNVKLLRRSFPIEFHCGPMPTLSFDAHSQKTTHGAVIFIHGEVVSLIYILMKVYALSMPIISHTSFDENQDESTIVEPVLSRADATGALADALRGFLARMSSGPPPFGGQGGAVANASINLSTAAIRFIIAHECGHILAGHLSRVESTFRNTPLQSEMAKWLPRLDESKLEALLAHQFTVNSAYQLAGSWDDEREADQNGLDLCLAPAWPINNSMERFHDASTRLAGPFIFFAIDDFINNAVMYLLGEDNVRELTSNHPPSAKRAEVMRSWIHQISVNSEALLDEGSRFGDWLGDISGEVYQRMTQT